MPKTGFFDSREWIAVVAAAFAVGGCWRPWSITRNRPYLWLCLGLMLVEIVVGLLGWYYHMQGHSPKSDERPLGESSRIVRRSSPRSCSPI